MEVLSNRGKFVKIMLTLIDIVIACISYNIAIGMFYPHMAWQMTNDTFVVSVFIAIFWGTLEEWLKTNEVYRSRSYAYVLYNCALQNVIGTVMITATIVLLGFINYGRGVLIIFGATSATLCFVAKVVFYKTLRELRRRGYNARHVAFICDASGEQLLNLMHRRNEWGFQIKAVVGDKTIVNKYGTVLPVYDISTTNIEELLMPMQVDELIYARKYESSEELQHYVDLCTDLGITFRLYSHFFNRLRNTTQLRYFDTNVVLTITNTPTNYVGLLLKRGIDIGFSAGVILFLSPVFLLLALIVKLDSRGPVFFKQKRTGLRGRVFEVYKFRTMVQNAEELKTKLMEQNEMDGPVFKMTHDPRITRAGRWMRKTSLDELPQFFNVFWGDMSIVGPRPPLPAEVAQYERWQLRRLAMRPGITCLWQVSRNRNDISFEDWMRMDMDYIDNWSVALDVVIVLKTIRTVLRADGK